MLQEGKANVIIDGQWGSTGKGKLAGYLYSHYPVDVAVCDFQPNAGHTYVDDIGRSFVLTTFPVGTLFEGVTCCIGPHSVINVQKFAEELDMIAKVNPAIHASLKIHPMASVVTELDRIAEGHYLKHVSSTMKGSAYAVIRKMQRDPSACTFAKDDDVLRPYVCQTEDITQDAVKNGKTVLLETAQGFDLGLNYGWSWPYVTSRDCLVGRVLDNAGISPKHLGSITASIRTYPIRVGSLDGFTSGPCYPDQRELTWEELSSQIGQDVKEITTVTKRVRRVFTFSEQQIIRFCKMVEPDYAFINFVNYLPNCLAALEMHQFTNELRQIVELLDFYGCETKLLGTGPKNRDIVEI